MGQEVDARIDIEESRIRLEVQLPPMLSFLAKLIEAVLRRQGAEMLEDKSEVAARPLASSFETAAASAGRGCRAGPRFAACCMSACVIQSPAGALRRLRGGERASASEHAALVVDQEHAAAVEGGAAARVEADRMGPIQAEAGAASSARYQRRRRSWR